MTRLIAFRLDDDQSAKIDKLFSEYGINAESMTQRWREFVDLACESLLNTTDSELSQSETVNKE